LGYQPNSAPGFKGSSSKNTPYLSNKEVKPKTEDRTNKGEDALKTEEAKERKIFEEETGLVYARARRTHGTLTPSQRITWRE